jgi:hypothetical protein
VVDGPVEEDDLGVTGCGRDILGFFRGADRGSEGRWVAPAGLLDEVIEVGGKHGPDPTLGDQFGQCDVAGTGL